MKIDHIVARQILDSRGNPTVEADVWLDSGVFGRASVPSGASTGIHEAVFRCDANSDYCGLSVYNAVDTVMHEIRPYIIGLRADDQEEVDRKMIELDGTENKSRLGANAILATSMATAKAAAKERGVVLYSHIADIYGNRNPKTLPMPLINLLNGGRHAHRSTDIQESMVVPIAATSMSQAIKMGAEIFYALKTVIEKHGYRSTVGDEGGFAPNVKNGNGEALELLAEAIHDAGYELGRDVVYALDVAASELFREKDDVYHFSAEHKEFNPDELINWYQQLSRRYPIVSIEDGMAQDDWEGWQKLEKAMSDMQLVGDDLLVTNAHRIQRAIDEKAGNTVLIKPNQIGTLSETLHAIRLAKEHDWRTIISHRSGETEDTAIVHIAVGTGAGQIKIGSLSRSERVAKYNELLRLEEIDPTLTFHQPDFHWTNTVNPVIAETV